MFPQSVGLPLELSFSALVQYRAYGPSSQVLSCLVSRASLARARSLTAWVLCVFITSLYLVFVRLSL